MNNQLEKQLGKVFGRHTKWLYKCQINNATTEDQKIKLAEEVLQEPCTGTIAEAQSYLLKLKGVTSINLADFQNHQTKEKP